MKNLKNINEFINESYYYDITKNLNHKDKKEYINIIESIDNYVEMKHISQSFNDGYYNKDGDKNLNGLKTYLDNKFSMKNILDYFFKKYKDIIYNDDSFISKNGFYDYMLYTYDVSFPLSGSEIGSEPDDKLLKYFYGFQTTKLGQIFINQNFESFNEFYKTCAENFADFFFESTIGYGDSDNNFIVKDFTCIINITPILNKKTIDDIKEEFENINNNISQSWKIIKSYGGFNYFIINFGEKKINMVEEFNRHENDIEQFEIKNNARKYNL